MYSWVLWSTDGCRASLPRLLGAPLSTTRLSERFWINSSTVWKSPSFTDSTLSQTHRKGGKKAVERSVWFLLWEITVEFYTRWENWGGGKKMMSKLETQDTKQTFLSQTSFLFCFVGFANWPKQMKRNLCWNGLGQKTDWLRSIKK